MIKKYLALLFTFVFLVGYVTATVYPHAFEGDIEVTDGKNPNGAILLALIDGVPMSSVTILGNHYDIVVEDFAGRGGVVSFMIVDEEADEEFNFVVFEKTFSNLTFDTVPEIILGGCGDGQCQDGECESCPADCSVNECSNNGVCDINVGEDCSNSPQDCGVCPYRGDGVCNNGESCSSCSGDCGACSSGSGGSGGKKGGGGGGGSTITLDADNDNSTDENLNVSSLSSGEDEKSPLSVNKLNEMNGSAIIEDEGFFSWITGRAAGSGINGGMNITGVVIILLIVLVLLYVHFRNKVKKK